MVYVHLNTIDFIFWIASNISPVSGCMLAFGIVMLCQGFGKLPFALKYQVSYVAVQSYGGLLATRFFLGLAEAGVFPGSRYSPVNRTESCINRKRRLLLD